MSVVAEKQLIDVPESLHKSIPTKYFVRARACYTTEISGLFRFGLSTSGKGKLKIDGQEVIDLWTSQPPKTDSTACFNRLSMERFHDIEVTKGQVLELEVLQVNENLAGGVGTALTLTGRVGGYELLDEDQSIKDAAELASKVDIPIVITGLSSDYEYEGSDRKNLRLPGHVDELIQAVLSANKNAVSTLHFYSGTRTDTVPDYRHPVWMSHRDAMGVRSINIASRLVRRPRDRSWPCRRSFRQSQPLRQTFLDLSQVHQAHSRLSHLLQG